MKQVFKSLGDANARMERVILIAGAIASDTPLPDDLMDFFEYEGEETIRNVFGDIPDGVDFDDEDSIVEWLTDDENLGYLVQFATLVMQEKGGHFSGNWSHYATNWVYGDTMEQAVEKGVAWVETVRSRERAKAEKGGE